MSNEIDWSQAPEGATHYHHEVEGKFSPRWFMQVMGGWKVWYQGFWQTATPAYSGIDVDSFVSRPKPWYGQGLPPVGTICEVRDQGAWHKVKIIGKDEDGYLVYRSNEWRDHPYDGCFTPEDFRPIRTPEQIAAEEREKAIHEIEDLIAGYSYGKCAEILYQAGYRRTKTCDPSGFED